MKKYTCLIVILMYSQFTPHLCNAQLDISAGVGIAYPELLTGSKIINSGQISSGIHVAAAWRPEELQFFPGISASYGAIRLPLQYAGNNVASLDLKYLSVMVNENFVADYGTNRLLLFGGIGFTYMKTKGAAPSGNETLQTSIDSTANITHLFPAINVGMEYAAYTGVNWHLGFGVSVKYTVLFERKNDYYITVSEPGNKVYEYAAHLSGNLLTPGLYVAVHYNIHSKK